MTTDLDLAWAVEEACLNAWPSPRDVLLDRWLLRAAGGPSRRINAVTPMRGAEPAGVAAMLAAAAPIYAALGQPLIVRVPDLVPGAHAPLDGLGFARQGETCTLYRPLDDMRPDIHDEVAVSVRPGAAWLALRATLQGRDPVAARVLETVLDTLILPRVFVGLPTPDEAGTDRLAACAFAVVHRDLLVIEAVGTDPAYRGRGFGGRAVAALMGWGRGQGATGACLQVVADNAVARRLYARLGFAAELYRYSYRVAPLES